MAENKFIDCKIKEIKTVHKGKWLYTNVIQYTDPKGETREYESISNPNKIGDDSTPDSVQVVAIFKRNSQPNCLVLVQQFRPAVGCISIEFPAGYVDESDKDIQSTALRELLEETGFSGTIVEGKHIEAPTSVEPGNQNETIATIYVEINGDDPKNIDCVQHLDDGEFIKVILVPVKDLLDQLNSIIQDKNARCLIDSKLYAFALGLHTRTTLLE